MNLLVQRNIPVTFTKAAVDVINETVQPDESPRVMKAIPLAAKPKPPTEKAHSKPETPTPSAAKSLPAVTPIPTPVKHTFPFQPFKKN